MNFWNRHIGDIIRDTVSLTMLEDGAYNRLLDQYYQTERPLPLDKKMIYRLARATSTAERRACDFVIETFFREDSDGYHQKRCDAEIVAYQEKQRKAQASANARWSKSEGNANADANASSSHNATDMRTHSEGNAHQAPVASSQSPELKTLGDTAPVEHPHVRARPAEISAAMRRNGIEAQPADPRIIAASEAGYAVETVEAACAEAKVSKPNERISPLYVLRIVERWTADAAAPRAAANGRAPARASPSATRAKQRRTAYQILTGNTSGEPHEPDANVVDVAAKRIG